ncbi:hypothetical protein niasHT_012599 [Heterodera trifolii]|uniref:Uncharacterized protein n=1 Tax=Heterodera trifolii TaxID=157864 RepID=A0ABD2L1F5_9BILA
MSDSRKEAEEKMAKAIFISGDGWLSVFDLLAPSQLGLGIALISHRFDFYVDEHFKTRKWTLRNIRIGRRIGENGTNEMVIVNLDGKALPIAQMQLPRKVIGFRRITITYIDHNVITFLHRFCQLFASCPINLSFGTNTYRILEFILPNIWPMFEKNICGLDCMRMISIVCDNASRHFSMIVHRFVLSLYILAICSPSFRPMTVPWRQMDKRWPNGFSLPIQTMCQRCSNAIWTSMTGIGRRGHFPMLVHPPLSLSSFGFVRHILLIAFDQTNELTREQLALKSTDYRRRFLLIRCPIERDASKWAKWEEEANVWEIYTQWNRIGIQITSERDIGDRLLNATPGPSDHRSE